MWNSRPPPLMEKNILNFHFDYLHPSLMTDKGIQRSYSVLICVVGDDEQRKAEVDKVRLDECPRGEVHDCGARRSVSPFSPGSICTLMFYFWRPPTNNGMEKSFFFQIANCFVNSAIFSASGTHSLILETSHTNLKLIDWLKVNLNSSLDSEWSIHLHW